MDEGVGWLGDPVAVGVARSVGRLAGLGCGSYHFLHVGHGDHPDTPIFALGAPPLLFWLLQDDKDLPLLEGEVLRIAASEVVQTPHILQVLVWAAHWLDGSTHRAWVPWEITTKGQRKETG